MYLHEEHYYLISNHAVARNSIFCDIGIQLHFKNKMKFYLEPLCKILSFNFRDHEFQILVRLKDRKAFEEFFERKTEGIEGQLRTPESTYIFSQAMSNLQVSLVKKFNNKNNRSGTLMAGRFKRELITSKEKVIELIKELNAGVQRMNYSGIWAECAVRRKVAMTSESIYKSLKMNDQYGNDSFWNEVKDNLVGKFEKPQILVQNYKFNFLERRLFNSICKYFS